ncbi:phage tail tube protein [Tindallia californiensis]|uniref:Phage tail tube protein n=1 Tax=Tindallia californiensis TaxID=159292 RepID=A0A1H3R338_9FIRM|nr:phage tail tube protein [Tindallia californiensis]SDZ19359.1 Phage tail tube protein [Tindallia californiensis]
MQEASKVMNGTYGSLWVDGELWAEVESFEAKVNMDYEDVNFANHAGTYKKGTGWNGEGSITIKKVYSRIQRKVANNIKKGIFPRSTIAGKLDDPEAHGAERVVLRDVTFNEATLLSFEQKTLGSTEVPFNFSDFSMPDMV